MLADPQLGFCRDSGSNTYPYVSPSNTNTTAGDATALRDWCKSWCAQESPDKVVGIATFDDGSNTYCYCLFSADNLPTGFNDAGFENNYDPPVTDRDGSSGTGCIAGTDGDTRATCYRNCAYNQCVSILLCISPYLYSSLTNVCCSFEISRVLNRVMSRAQLHLQLHLQPPRAGSQWDWPQRARSEGATGK